ncbi:MAG: hypothetical protein MZU95_10185 [Desulfomicrobium escambiense]|nr:hypothetical protein [Desulfomicrobium escambiense]
MAVLKQDHFAFEDAPRPRHGRHRRLRQALRRSMKEREALYAKDDFSEADGHPRERARGRVRRAGRLGGRGPGRRSSLSGLGVPGSLPREADEGGRRRRQGPRPPRPGPVRQSRHPPPRRAHQRPRPRLASPGSRSSSSSSRTSSSSSPTTATSSTRSAPTSATSTSARCACTRATTTSGTRHAAASCVSSRRTRRSAARTRCKDLKEFIQRFASNASKSRQATSRKKILEKLERRGHCRSSRRRFPYVGFKPERDLGNNVLGRSGHLPRTSRAASRARRASTLPSTAATRSPSSAGSTWPRPPSSRSSPARTTDYAGDFYWGQTMTHGLLPQGERRLFDSDLTIVEWLKQYTLERRRDLHPLLPRADALLRRRGPEASPRPLRRGEGPLPALPDDAPGANCLILDEPTNHLDLESITALNNGLIEFPGVILFTSHDHEFVNSDSQPHRRVLPRRTSSTACMKLRRVPQGRRR